MRLFIALLLLSSLDLIISRGVPHIIGGRNAKPGEFPYQGSLQRLDRSNADADNSDNYDDRQLTVSLTPIDSNVQAKLSPIDSSVKDNYIGHICGCVLISDVWVLTAAHCVGSGVSQLYVVMGLHIRGDASKGSPTRYDIEDIIVFPGYDQQTLSNDIALIKLSSKVKLNQYVRPVPLAPYLSNQDNQMCNITGWGVTTQGGGSLSRTLQVAEVRVMPNAQCDKIWGVIGIDKTQICVSVPFEKGACNGDSGGPLVCSGQLAGLTSFGQTGCYTDTPSVYTRVSEYRGFIKTVAGL